MASASQEQLVLLHQELAALIRAGMPLDTGLRALSRDLPGSIGKIAAEMAARLERGEPIDEVVQQSKSPQQRIFGAVVAAGLRSGNLGGALESIVESSRANDQMRRSLWVELAYPLLVIMLGWGLLSFSFDKLFPVLVRYSDSFDAGLPIPAPLIYLGYVLHEHPLIESALLVAIVLGVGWILHRATSLTALNRSWLGPLGQYRRSLALARFYDVLALLVGHSVPLAEALVLAGEASGWKQLAIACNRAAERIRRGEKVTAEAPLPASVAWLSGGDAADWKHVLRREAAYARTRAETQSRWVIRWVPMMITFAVGLTFVSLLALFNLGPFLNILWRLTRAD